jgi:hypothetical protein
MGRINPLFVLRRKLLAVAVAGTLAGTSAACVGRGAQSGARTSYENAKPTLAEAAAECRRLQDERTIPVHCMTREIGGVPSMFIAFQAQEAADRHLATVADQVAGPFCDAANDSNRPASVYVAIKTWAKRYNCELGQWGEWFAFSGDLAALREDGNARPRSRDPKAAIADAATRCRRIQESTTIPVACKLQYLDEVPSMVIGFRNEQEAAEFLRPMAETVAGPFCDAANSSGQHAAVAVVVGRESARLFDCERGQWGDWFTLGEERDDSSRSAEISL